MASSPMYLNAISLTCNVWFPDNERATAGALMTLASPLGSLLAFIIQAIFIFEEGENPTSNDVRQTTYNMLNFENILITLFALFMIVTIREIPEHPPSNVALNKVNTDAVC